MAPTIAVLLVLLMSGSNLAYAENFSCPMGTTGACLDYSDTVCSARGKCVDRNAQCFDSFTCDYKGFTCKSDADELADSCKKMADDYDELVEKYNRLLRANKHLADCLQSSTTIEAMNGFL